MRLRTLFAEGCRDRIAVDLRDDARKREKKAPTQLLKSGVTAFTTFTYYLDSWQQSLDAWQR